MKNEKELLDLFVATDKNRPSLHHPFLQEGKVCASDGRVLIRIDAALCEGDYSEYPYGVTPPRTSKAIPSVTCDETLTLQMLQDAWNKMPAEELDRTCKECDGEGMVTWMYLDSEGNSYGMEAHCPLCHGTGVVSPYKALKCLFTIHGNLFSFGSIEVLKETMKYLEVDELQLKHYPKPTDPRHVAVLFGVKGKDIDIVISPQVGPHELEEIKIL